ncbi:lipocalin family protein [Marivirga sp.]|uniref:lipocalin family protein n=1 Tax=Marivirga sp. TaxID=2018662 RepID=UPI0025D1FE04|nr:lipocalin family protein [Marivirga sp.]
MKSIFTFTLLCSSLIFVLSCTLERKIIGTWQIESYSEESGDGSSANAKNIGTIQLNKDGVGSNDLSYRILGNERTEKADFTYNLNDQNITIKTDGESELAKSWIIIESRNDFQKWKSTDGKGNVQTLILIKE